MVVMVKFVVGGGDGCDGCGEIGKQFRFGIEDGEKGEEES